MGTNADSMASSCDAAQLTASPPRDRWYVLGVLTAVYALNIADRFSMSTLIEPIRQELHLSDSGIAFLTGVALALFYVTVGIPIAALADRANRRNILALALLVWSGMTALCGLAQSYGQLLLARFAVGIGEAGGTPPSTSILADAVCCSFCPSARTRSPVTSVATCNRLSVCRYAPISLRAWIDAGSTALAAGAVCA